MPPTDIKKKNRLFMCCPSCNSFHIIHDYVHAEYYCGDCGLIVASNNEVKRHSIVKLKPKPRLLTNEDKMNYITDLLIYSLNIKLV